MVRPDMMNPSLVGVGIQEGTPPPLLGLMIRYYVTQKKDVPWVTSPAGLIPRGRLCITGIGSGSAHHLSLAVSSVIPVTIHEHPFLG